MGREIERKFLVAGDGWRPGDDGRHQRQGYLTVAAPVVRVRIEAGCATLTIKSAQDGLTRAEYEYAIPLADADEMLDTLCPFAVEKTRYLRTFAGHTWEVDVFHGRNDGLVVAEVELGSEDEAVELPPWVGEDVSHDVRYRVAYLSQHAYKTWGEDGGD